MTATTTPGRSPSPVGSNLLGAVDARLDRAAELVAVSACRLWPAQWDHLDRLTHSQLAAIVGDVRARWGALVAAAATLRTDLPYRPDGSRWEAWSAAGDPDRLCRLSGWNRDDLERLNVWTDPERSPLVLAAITARLAGRNRWRALVPAAAAILAAVDAGRRPPADALEQLAAEVAA